MSEEKVEIKKATEKGTHKKTNANKDYSGIEFGRWDKSKDKFRKILTKKERIPKE